MAKSLTDSFKAIFFSWQFGIFQATSSSLKMASKIQKILHHSRLSCWTNSCTHSHSSRYCRCSTCRFANRIWTIRRFYGMLCVFHVSEVFLFKNFLFKSFNFLVLDPQKTSQLDPQQFFPFSLTQLQRN